MSMAVRVPDHGKLTPWRFVVFEGEGRAGIGEVFRRRWAALHPDHGEDSLQFAANLFMRAPVVVAVVSTATAHVKIPVWEQQLSAGAVCLTLEMAVLAHGFHSQWQTDWIAYDSETHSAMGLVEGEKIAGLIYIGTSTVPLEDRPRPDVAALVIRWGA